MPSYSQIQQITISGVTNTGNPNAPAYLRKGDVNTTYERLNKYNDAERTELLYYDESGQETTDPINPTTGEPTREIVPILKNARPIWRKSLFSSWPDISYADIYYDGSNWKLEVFAYDETQVDSEIPIKNLFIEPPAGIENVTGEVILISTSSSSSTTDSPTSSTFTSTDKISFSLLGDKASEFSGSQDTNPFGSTGSGQNLTHALVINTSPDLQDFTEIASSTSYFRGFSFTVDNSITTGSVNFQFGAANNRAKVLNVAHNGMFKPELIMAEIRKAFDSSNGYGFSGGSSFFLPNPTITNEFTARQSTSQTHLRDGSGNLLYIDAATLEQTTSATTVAASFVGRGEHLYEIPGTNPLETSTERFNADGTTRPPHMVTDDFGNLVQAREELFSAREVDPETGQIYTPEITKVYYLDNAAFNQHVSEGFWNHDAVTLLPTTYKGDPATNTLLTTDEFDGSGNQRAQAFIQKLAGHPSLNLTGQTDFASTPNVFSATSPVFIHTDPFGTLNGGANFFTPLVLNSITFEPNQPFITFDDNADNLQFTSITRTFTNKALLSTDPLFLPANTAYAFPFNQGTTTNTGIKLNNVRRSTITFSRISQAGETDYDNNLEIPGMSGIKFLRLGDHVTGIDQEGDVLFTDPVRTTTFVGDPSFETSELLPTDQLPLQEAQENNFFFVDPNDPSFVDFDPSDIINAGGQVIASASLLDPVTGELLIEEGEEIASEAVVELLFLDSNGNETTTDTGTPAFTQETDPSGDPLFQDTITGLVTTSSTNGDGAANLPIYVTDIQGNPIQKTQTATDDQGNSVFTVTSTTITDSNNNPVTVPVSSNSSSDVSVTFMGGKVISFNATVGWGGDASSVTVQLVEPSTDTFCAGGSFSNSMLGTVKSFSFGKFKFDGLLSNWEKTEGTSGETVTVRLSSPAVILKNAVCALQGLADEASGGYGGGGIGSGMNIIPVSPETSWCNDYGPTWGEVRSAIEGATLYYKGGQFRVNLSGVGVAGIRYSGDSVNVMGAIDKAAQAAGQRIYVYLSGYTINVIAANKTNSAVGASIDSSGTGIINDTTSSIRRPSGCNTAITLSRGIESADAVSASMVNGDFVRTVEECGTGGGILQYFGKDPGVVEGGHVTLDPYEDENADELSFTVNTEHDVAVNAAAGGEYEIELLELRAAMAGFEPWKSYITQNKPEVLTNVGLEGAADPLNIEAFVGFLNATNEEGVARTGPNEDEAASFANSTELLVRQLAASSDNKQAIAKLKALHDYVKSFSKFYGSKFLVPLPAPLGQCGETLNYEKSDGGWHEEGSILGLDTFPPFFKTDDQKIKCFVKFTDDFPEHDSIEGGVVVDASKLGDEFYARSKNELYIAGDVEEFITYEDEPYAIVNVKAPLSLKPKSKKVKDDLRYGLLMQMITDEGAEITDEQMEEVCGKTALLRLLKNKSLAGPMHTRPEGFCIPIKSNIASYGPWSATQGVGGSSEYKRDNSLSPWSYAGTGAMNSAAQLMVSSALHGQSVIESGSVQHAGAPQFDMGRGLISAGPDVSNISVQIGANGARSTITFRTFVPNTGALADERLHSLKRMAENTQDLQRAFDTRMVERMTFANRRFQSGLSLAELGGPDFSTLQQDVQDEENDMVGAETSVDESGDDGGGGASGRGTGYKPGDGGESSGGSGQNDKKMSGTTVVTSSKYTSLQSVRLKGDSFQRRGGITWDGLIRPFSIGENQYLSQMKFEDDEGTAHTGKEEDDEESIIEINSATSNPFLKADKINEFHLQEGDAEKGHDMHTIIHGDDYPTDGLYSSEGKGDGDKVRPMALRGPLVVSGWGYDTEGFPVPNKSEGDEDKVHYFTDDWLRKTQKWKTGPVDLRWDYSKQMWVPPATPGIEIVPISMGNPGTPQANACWKDITETQPPGFDGDAWSDTVAVVPGTVWAYAHHERNGNMCLVDEIDFQIDQSTASKTNLSKEVAEFIGYETDEYHFPHYVIVVDVGGKFVSQQSTKNGSYVGLGTSASSPSHGWAWRHHQCFDQHVFKKQTGSSIGVAFYHLLYLENNLDTRTRWKSGVRSSDGGGQCVDSSNNIFRHDKPIYLNDVWHIDSYVATNNQVLTHQNGVMQWIDIEDC